jgi:hypothetical protein
MLKNAGDIMTYRLSAGDGDLGQIVKLLFDEETWTVRYIVVRTRGQDVFVSPVGITSVDNTRGIVVAGSTGEALRAAPSFDTGQPVTRSQESDYFDYHGWHAYWEGESRWGDAACPGPLLSPPRSEERTVVRSASCDSFLRVTDDVEGFSVQCPEGELGCVKDLLIDLRTWAIRYTLIDTGERRLLLSPHWIDQIGWLERTMIVDIPAGMLRKAPPYGTGHPVTDDYERRLFTHYGKIRDLEAVHLRRRTPALYR